MNNLRAELGKRIKILQIQQFRFQNIKEVFHDRIVQTVELAVHALLDFFFSAIFDNACVCNASPDRNAESNLCRPYLLKRLFQHFCYHTANQSVMSRVRYDIPAVQIQDRREIQLTCFSMPCGFLFMEVI